MDLFLSNEQLLSDYVNNFIWSEYMKQGRERRREEVKPRKTAENRGEERGEKVNGCGLRKKQRLWSTFFSPNLLNFSVTLLSESLNS